MMTELGKFPKKAWSRGAVPYEIEGNQLDEQDVQMMLTQVLLTAETWLSNYG